jgi:hypothetical protein
MNATRTLFSAFVTLILTGSPAAAETLTSSDVLRVEFSVNSNFDNYLPDVLKLNLGLVEVLAPMTSRSAALYDGNTLLGTATATTFANYQGLLNLDPVNSFRSPSSPWDFDSPATVDFSSILDGSVRGAIELTIATGAMEFEVERMKLMLVKAWSRGTGDLVTPWPIVHTIMLNDEVLYADSSVFSGGREGDKFGWSVASIGDVNGDDVNDFVVGAPYNDDNGTNAGRIYVYSGAHPHEELWSQTGERTGDRFGWSVAGSDLAVVVGAPFSDDQAARAGKIYVFGAVTGDLLFSKRGKARNDRFGFSVATGVDVNDDGFDDVLAGAPYCDVVEPNAGRVTIYSGRNGKAMKTLRGESRGDLFGWSIAGVGRLDRDQYEDFVVGAPRSDENASNAGKVYAFAGKRFEVLYTVSGRQRGDQFGRSVAAAGRVDGDGREDFAVGAPYFDRGVQRQAGRVEMFSGRSGKRLWARNGRRHRDFFGWSIASAGDVDGDGSDDLLVGAPRYDGGADNTGRVYVRSGRNGATLKSFHGENGRNDRLGFAVAGLGDLHGRGTQYFLLGAYMNDSAFNNAGRIFLVGATR